MSDSQGPRIPGEERSRRGLTAGRIILVLVILALLALLIPLACQALRGSDTEEQTSRGNSEESTEETTGLESAAGGAARRDEEAQTASAEISALEDQSGDGTTLTVGSATISGTDGWVAVHRDDGSGRPQVPQSIGQAPLREGENTDVVVALDEPVNSSQTLYAMIHTDNPADGTYTFPNGDPPVEVNGGVVVEPLRYTIVDRASGRLPDSGGVSPMVLPLAGAALIALVGFTLRFMRATR